VDGSGIATEFTASRISTSSDPGAVLAVNLAPVGGAAGLFVYVTNVTTNNVDIFQVCTEVNANCTQPDVDIARMTLVGSPVSVGQDPVAITVDPTKNFLYVVNRNSNSVSGFRINQTTGGLTALSPATVSTGSNPVALTIHPNGEFVYVSNSGSDNISGFKVSTLNGALSTSATVTSAAQPAGLAAK
jgi:6-phosphogluconolactonase (cycloisomerase 2 family)